MITVHVTNSSQEKRVKVTHRDAGKDTAVGYITPGGTISVNVFEQHTITLQEEPKEETSW